MVALTHFKLARDLKLAKKVPEVDLILGGHDHEYLTQYVKPGNPRSTLVVKSGMPFPVLPPPSGYMFSSTSSTHLLLHLSDTSSSSPLS